MVIKKQGCFLSRHISRKSPTEVRLSLQEKILKKGGKKETLFLLPVSGDIVVTLKTVTSAGTSSFETYHQGFVHGVISN